MSNKKQVKDIINQEKVFRAIAENPGDLVTVQERLIKHKVVDSRTKLRNALEALTREGRIVVKGKEVSINPSLIKQGRFVQSGSSGYIVLDGDSHQYYIDRNDINGAKPNSSVLVSFYQKVTRSGVVNVPFIAGQAREKEIVAGSVEPEQEDIVYGRVMKTNHDELIFLPNDKRRFRLPIFIGNDKRTVAKFQDKICTMKIIDGEEGDRQAVGILLDIKGDAGNPIAEYDAIAESHGAIMSFSDPAVQKEIAELPTEVDLSYYSLCSEEQYLSSFEKEPIVDLRELNFTTTDPATCKDMDDAIYSTFDRDGNLVTYVAVANVTKYVRLNSEIGRRYVKAGFTTYAPNKAYNILPPELSTNICSLNPDVDRLALVIKSVIDPRTGKPISSSIMDAVIRSKEKYSYEQAQEICDTSKISEKQLKTKCQKGEPLTREEQVVMNSLASDILWKGFKDRDIIEFDSNNEYDVLLNSDMSDIVDLQKQEHIKYHKVIEAFMISANEATAEYALKNNIPNIYRVHDLPNETKLARAYEFFGYLNIPFDGDLSPIGIRNVVEFVKGTEKEKVVNNFLVRLQSKAKYCNTPNPADVRMIGKPSLYRKPPKSTSRSAGTNFEREKDDILREGISHFGLQSQHYSHTTSPIRRVTDYVTHYNILAHIKGKKMLDEKIVREIALWANQMQDAVDSSEYEFRELNGAIYCTHHINETMKGRICSFRKLADKKDVSADEVVVIVENEDKGVKVELPLSEVLEYRGGNCRNIAVSANGSAIINKETKAPILTLSQELTFRITESDRNTRQVLGSMNLTPENDRRTAPSRRGEAMIDFPKAPTDRKIEQMLKNREFCKGSALAAQNREDEINRYGYKFKNQMNYDDIAGEMYNNEAYYANRAQSKSHKRKKYKELIEEHLAQGEEEFVQEPDDDEKE